MPFGVQNALNDHRRHDDNDGGDGNVDDCVGDRGVVYSSGQCRACVQHKTCSCSVPSNIEHRRTRNKRCAAVASLFVCACVCASVCSILVRDGLIESGGISAQASLLGCVLNVLLHRRDVCV